MKSDQQDRLCFPLSHKDEVLLCLAHPKLSTKRSQRLANLLVSPTDWAELLDQADRHGITPLLHHHLKQAPALTIPETTRTTLAERSRSCLAWNLRLSHELLYLLDRFNEAGIPVMPLKGLYLADLLYKDSALRPTSDLDLLVKVQDFEASQQILEEAGCTKLADEEQGAEYHVSYVTTNERAGHVLIELHRALGESHVAGLDIEAVWRSATPIIWEGRTIWTMAIPDLFLYTCLHAVKDGLASIRSLLDITLLLERYGQNLPWQELTQRVKQARIETPVSLSLLLSRELLEASLPSEFLAAIRPSRNLSRLLGQALFRWRGGVLHVPQELLVGPFMALLMLCWEDSLKGKRRHLRRNLLPSEKLQGRWISQTHTSTPFRRYQAWLWEICLRLTSQLTARSHSRQPGAPRH
ncbi:MAG: nucleotidyltransferase family protein [Nitrospirae bacterium]|nr:nucleotidyltransferase family protein [Nitrospirota bacterium]